MQRVVVDANVFISYLTGRHEKQYDAASSLLQEAEDGHLVAVLPQFVVFEVTYVLQSLYNVNGGRLASMVSALVSFPGVLAVAAANRYDAVATFDRKLSNRLEAFGLAAYW